MDAEQKYKWGNRLLIGGVCCLLFFPSYTFVGVVMLLAGALLRFSRNEQQSTTRRKQIQLSDEQIMRLARIKGGIITSAELAMESSMSIQEAESRLAKMYSEGLSNMYVSEKGVIVYDFRHLFSPTDEKRQIKD